jgi:hypothetical protein
VTTPDRDPLPYGRSRATPAWWKPASPTALVVAIVMGTLLFLVGALLVQEAFSDDQGVVTWPWE